MRRIPKLPFLVLIPLMGACASGLAGGLTGPGGTGTGASSTNTGSGSSSGSVGGFASTTTGGNNGGGPGSTGAFMSGTSNGGSGVGGGAGGANCGFATGDPTCDSCIDGSCCSEGLACANDSTCTSCVESSNPPASCNSDAAFTAFGNCLEASCVTQCGGGSGGAGGGSNTGAGGALSGAGGSSSTGCGLESSVPACNTCLDNSCCSQALACANDSSCTECLGTNNPPPSCNTNANLTALGDCLDASCNSQCNGGSSSSSSSSSSGSTSGGPPTNCTEAYGEVGCCYNNVNYYCTGNTLEHKTCSGQNPNCGWSASNMYYACGANSGADPSGQNPQACQ